MVSEMRVGLQLLKHILLVLTGSCHFRDLTQCWYLCAEAGRKTVPGAGVMQRPCSASRFS